MPLSGTISHNVGGEALYSLVIVDDEEDVLEGLRDYFPWESVGFSVEKAFLNSQDAIAFCKERRPDVVLTDIRLPVIDGFALISRITESVSPPPLFCIISAYGDFEYAQRAIRLGVKDYLVKPASFDDVKKVFLGLKKTLDERSSSVLNANPETSNALVSKAIEIIEKKTGSCSLESISSDLGVNHSYLSRLFKKETGENFQSFLMRKKTDMAKSMLIGSCEYSNAEIAKALGYQDTPNFCRLFKKVTGLSPQRYRKENKR